MNKMLIWSYSCEINKLLKGKKSESSPGLFSLFFLLYCNNTTARGIRNRFNYIFLMPWRKGLKTFLFAPSTQTGIKIKLRDFHPLGCAIRNLWASQLTQPEHSIQRIPENAEDAFYLCSCAVGICYAVILSTKSRHLQLVLSTDLHWGNLMLQFLNDGEKKAVGRARGPFSFKSYHHRICWLSEDLLWERMTSVPVPQEKVIQTVFSGTESSETAPFVHSSQAQWLFLKSRTFDF